MNASLHTLSSLPSEPSPVSGKDKKQTKSKRKPPRQRAARRVTKAKSVVNNDATLQEYRDCLQQAEICHEQAQEAARLRRFKAARGLFSTAIALCQRALGLREKPAIAPAAAAQIPITIDENAAEDARQAREYLHELTIEMSTYSDLERSLERPLRNNAPK